MKIEKEEHVIKRTIEFVKNKLKNEGSGHDWWHVYRVWKLALKIAKEEKNVDLFVIQLSALLHEIADWKFGDETSRLNEVREFLENMNVNEEIISHVCEIVSSISFKGAGVVSKMKTREGMIVQDADRLDALGAIGIARCFAFGAIRGQPIYDPEIKPRLHKSFEEYRNAKTTSINHFYEKLLLLKDLMNTETAKKIAEERHNFMEQFLDKFFKEWEEEC